jgi:peptide methionine sulfoxide reductase msrA/msrB
MYGGRITSEEKSTLSGYIAIAFAVLLTSTMVYFFFLAQHEKNEMRGFDPKRPVPSDEVLKGRLKAEEYFVVRENGSEMPFQNEFWNNQRAGIYVDVITGEPLFSSLDKFDSGLGIPAFSQPISKDILVEKLDRSADMQRTEVRAKRSDAHLGYVFSDPKSPTGRRYSIYSAALHFIPKEEMQERTYRAYLPLLRKK